MMVKDLLIVVLVIAAIVAGWAGLIYLHPPEFSRGWFYLVIFVMVFAFGQVMGEHWNSTGDKVAKLKRLVCVIIPLTIFYTFGVFLIGPAFIGVIYIFHVVFFGIPLFIFAQIIESF